MQYFRNYELANLYGVSQSAVGKWVEAAKNGKLELILIESEDKSYIANTAKNMSTIEDMVRERKKYFNSRSHKVITPTKEFYELFNSEQIMDIVANLQTHGEVPRQYNYFNGGATYWDSYTNRLDQEKVPNILNSTTKLLKLNQPYIDHLVADYKRVNVIDIGPGNGLPIKGLLSHLIESGKQVQYTAIDISETMNEIALRNIKQWFGNKIEVEAHTRDISYQRFTDLFTAGPLAKQYDDSINIVLFLGGTLGNFRIPEDVLTTIRNSMRTRDVFMCTQKLDTETARRYFDFSFQPGVTTLPSNHRLVFNLLNIDESLYEVEMGYSEQERARFIRVRLKIALSIRFRLGGEERHVDLNKGDKILLWRVWHQNITEVITQFEDSEFDLVQASLIEKGEYLLNMHRIKPTASLLK